MQISAVLHEKEGCFMKNFAVWAGVLLLSNYMIAQTASTPAVASSASVADTITIPVGSRIPLSLKQAISTKTAKEGDAVYAETTFPFVLNDRIVVPTGTYVQGKISHVKRGGHVKGRAEIMIHFTSLIYPSGYTVLLPGALENVPGAERSTVKGSEGTVQQDSDTKKKVGTVATTAGTGAAIGGITNGLKGAGVGAGVGGAAGLAVAMLTRGGDVRLEPGTSVEMEIQREVQLDGHRINR
jgi:type IV secretion system protein VirB10